MQRALEGAGRQEGCAPDVAPVDNSRLHRYRVSWLSQYNETTWAVHPMTLFSYVCSDASSGCSSFAYCWSTLKDCCWVVPLKSFKTPWRLPLSRTWKRVNHLLISAHWYHEYGQERGQGRGDTAQQAACITSSSVCTVAAPGDWKCCQKSYAQTEKRFL